MSRSSQDLRADRIDRLVAELTALDVGQNGRLAGAAPRREPLGTP